MAPVAALWTVPLLNVPIVGVLARKFLIVLALPAYHVMPLLLSRLCSWPRRVASTRTRKSSTPVSVTVYQLGLQMSKSSDIPVTLNLKLVHCERCMPVRKPSCCWWLSKMEKGLLL
eukprot:scaffold80859_cov19-Prasinocladus_malaysianus.AAC.1